MFFSFTPSFCFFIFVVAAVYSQLSMAIAREVHCFQNRKGLFYQMHFFIVFILSVSQILDDFKEKKGFNPYNEDDSYDNRRKNFFDQLHDFPEFVSSPINHPFLFHSLFCLQLNRAPFTIQRLCEVIIKPDHYTQTNNLLFGLEKVCFFKSFHLFIFSSSFLFLVSKTTA